METSDYKFINFDFAKNWSIQKLNRFIQKTEQIPPEFTIGNNIAILQKDTNLSANAICSCSLYGNVLEIGSNMGYITFMIKSKFPNCQLLSVESDLECISYAKELFPKLNFVYGDAFNLPKNCYNRFDFIILSKVPSQKPFYNDPHNLSAESVIYNIELLREKGLKRGVQVIVVFPISSPDIVGERSEEELLEEMNILKLKYPKTKIINESGCIISL